MSRDAVFIDSGAFIAFLDRSDQHHAAVASLFARAPVRWSTSLAVVAETYSWFLHRLGEEAARQFRAALASLPRLQLLELDAAHHHAVMSKLDALRGLKLTYVDASCLVFLARHGIRVVWGTDADLSVEGARVLPR